MLRGFFFLLLSLCVLAAAEYPKSFERLGTPLFKSAEISSSLSDIEALAPEVKRFQSEAMRVQKRGRKLEILQEDDAFKSYLLELRKLQKNYDYLLHLIHKEILKSIKEEEYKKFIRLTSLELDGLLKNKSIQERSLRFYKQNKTKEASLFLEKIMSDETLLEESTQEFYNEVTHLEYSSDAKKSTQMQSVSIYISRIKDEINVSFVNSNPYDVTVSVNPRYKNIQESPKTSHIFVIKAKSSRHYSKLRLTAQESSYGYSYSWIIGDMSIAHDDSYIYRLPYQSGKSYRVSQGYNGATTHKGSSQYAIDFAMPEGTKVYAAREGVVVKCKSDSSSGGFEKRFSKDGNYITIAHSDGTLATYYHLKQGGVRVKVGQKVSQAQHIGYSGNTGYSSGPHLHFAVFRAVSHRATQTIAVKYMTQNGILDLPIKGQSYAAK